MNRSKKSKKQMQWDSNKQFMQVRALWVLKVWGRAGCRTRVGDHIRRRGKVVATSIFLNVFLMSFLSLCVPNVFLMSFYRCSYIAQLNMLAYLMILNIAQDSGG
jgi:hypothetical protein